MARRIFIVAKDNVAVYNSLTQALRREQDVEIIYDRRRDTKRNDFGEAFRKVFSRRTPDPAVRKEERRQRAKIDEQIRTQGWAVVRIEGQEFSLDSTAAEKYTKLRSVWSAPREEDPVVAVLVEHGGLCLDCLAEKAKLSLDRVMVAVRRTQSDVLLAFVTRACALCSRKSLVTYVRDRLAARNPFSPAAPGGVPTPLDNLDAPGVVEPSSLVRVAGDDLDEESSSAPPVPSGATA